jgi:hypothetical protein
MIFSHLEQRLGSLRTWRYSWWTYWAQLAEYILPRRYHWLVTPNTMDRGFPINQAIMDGEATLAMQICASGLLSGLMSSSRPWCKLGIGLPGYELDAEGQMWVEDTEQRLYTVLAQSNFYTTMAQAFEDVVTFGTAPVIIYEDYEDLIRCYGPCAGEYYLAAGARLDVDVLYREFTYTIAQIVEWFGLESCPEVIRKAWQNGGATIGMEYVVAHAIEPNFPLSGKDGKRVDVVKGDFIYREIYWLKGQKTEAPLSIRGFREKPFFAARWSRVSNDAYGRSPAMDALGDTKQLQLETRRKAEFIEKGIRPPMGADPELKNEPASILPAHITYTDTQGGRKGFWPIFEVNPAMLTPMIADMADIRKRIARFFRNDLFLMISQMDGVQPRNEMEIAARKGEQIQQIGPFIELFETEVAGPAIYRILAILERRRMLKPKPKSLMNMPIKIEYVSMMKLAQRAAETVSMEQGFKMGGGLSAAAKAAGLPDPLRIINLDESYRDYLGMMAFPTSGLYSADQVAMMDQQKIQAMQKQAQAQQAMQATQAGVQAANTLSDTDVGGGRNALQMMLQGQQGQP